MTNAFIDFLKEQDVEYQESFNMSKMSSIAIGGIARLAVMPNSEEKLIKTIDFIFDKSLPYTLVGRMTNILPVDDVYNGVLITTSNIRSYCVAENVCRAECGVSFSKLLVELAKLDFGGMEELFSIPGSVGGMVYGNAGAYGKSISDFIISARVYDVHQRNVYELRKADLDFKYRDSLLKKSGLVLLSANFLLEHKSCEDVTRRFSEIVDIRKRNQPYDSKSLGSIFKRKDGFPISKLIDTLGLKGTRIGGAVISEKHAGFIVNKGGATRSDVIDLIELIKTRLYVEYGIIAEEEIQFMK